MPDLDSQIRAAIEALVKQRMDAEAAARGWDLGADAYAALQAAGLTNPAFTSPNEFATGLDPITNLTVMPFTFDLSALDGPDVLA
jgi:hypothetical protein